MSKTWLVGIATVGLVTASIARADDITAKKILIKDNANAAKRQVIVLSIDAGVLKANADDPGTNGASIHVYSATDDYCAVLAGGPLWTDNGVKWKYFDSATKNLAQVKDGRLLVKLKNNVGFSLDEGTQGHVNVVVTLGTGAQYCMQCPGNKKDDTKKFLGKLCAATACDPEPSTCTPLSSTSTSSSTSTTSSTVTTTTLQAPGTVLQGALPPTTGRFNFNLTLGIPGANAACNGLWPGSHSCTYAEIQSAEAAGDLLGRKDANGNLVNSFWAIDGTHSAQVQCIDDTLGGSNLNWEYQTAHTGTFAEKVNLNNGLGTLGPLLSGLVDGAVCAGSSWVGCCL
jgi:hypothetical protein